ncbi:MAG TPA: histidine phosphatase family protein [Terriglobales bacterium]|nr:histidine phosphatase family protein [Terriglobales bacterium]
MLTLILTRHGEAASGDIMLGGQLDVTLTPEGRQEAEALARRLAGIRIDRIVSSPMLRALETAQTLATGRPVEVDERLRELDYGRWEGLTYEEIDARDPELRTRWDHDPGSTHSPGGESGEDVAARALSFLVELLEDELATAAAHAAASGRHSPDPGGSRGPVTESQAEAEGERRVLVVAHGTFNRILLCVALGLPVQDYRRRFVQDRANLTVLRYEHDDTPDGAQLILGNDVGHLRSKGQAPWG